MSSKAEKIKLLKGRIEVLEKIGCHHPNVNSSILIYQEILADIQISIPEPLKFQGKHPELVMIAGMYKLFAIINGATISVIGASESEAIAKWNTFVEETITCG